MRSFRFTQDENQLLCGGDGLRFMLKNFNVVILSGAEESPFLAQGKLRKNTLLSQVK